MSPNRLIQFSEGNLFKQTSRKYFTRYIFRCFELKGKFPHDHAIIVSIWDWDLTSADDLIGETKIDIENRFYSKHRAHCGISGEYYEYYGYNHF